MTHHVRDALHESLQMLHADCYYSTEILGGSCLNVLKLLSLRRKQLIEQSRTWITADTLDARIDHALDNPIPLSGIMVPSEEQVDAPRS